MEKLRWRDDLFEVVETARDEHKQLYQQLSAIHADLQVSVQDDECATSGHHRVIGQFQALELKFEMFVKKYNDPSTSRRGLRFADEWRERVNLKTDLMALKTSIGLTNFGTAVKSRTKEVTDTSSAMVTRARAATKEATDNSVAKVKEATDNSVAKMKEATDTSVSKVHDVLHDGKAGVASQWDAALKLSRRGLTNLRLQMMQCPLEATTKRLEDSQALSDTVATTASVDTGQNSVFQEPDQTEYISRFPDQELIQTWDDETITAVRIPRKMVLLESFVSRGAFGEVYKGTYGGKPVAVKMLLPSNRQITSHVVDFMKEVKIAATMDHPNIVRFIGVAWESLTTDLCSVTELMEGGDLKALMEKYEEENYPTGFDRPKMKIAMDVVRGLAYLHSLAPPVIHRDLKSKNILLSQDLDAKLTDFGISRERIDRTMTAGVGTSLWMSPEVMLGESYNEKADIFSLGVVLAELSTNTAPYSHATRPGSPQKLPPIAIMHQVATGQLTVEFSEAGPQSVVELGRACVSTDPKDRPTAAEALATLENVFTQEMDGKESVQNTS